MIWKSERVARVIAESQAVLSLPEWNLVSPKGVMELGDDFDECSDRLRAVYESFPPEQEQACFEQQVRHMEEGRDEMRSRADTWAQGYIDDFRKVPRVFDEWSACDDLFMVLSAS